MSDYLPFERIIYRKPEFVSIEENVWIWFIWTSLPVPPGHYRPIYVYTVPYGYKAVISDIIVGAEYRGEAKFYITGGDNIYWAYFEPYHTISHSFVLPPVALVGQTITCEYWNHDIIPGNIRFVFSMWNIPGSQPEKPKKDDPEERFRVGDFSSVEQIILPDGETLYFFRKRNEGKMNYLRFKDYGKPKQKVLTSAHLELEEAEEIISTLREKPEKVKKVLEKIEEKNVLRKKN